MSRADEGALVNLTPSDIPNDVYQKIAGRRYAEIQARYPNDVIVSPFMGRAWVKQAVMTYFYSASHRGMVKEMAAKMKKEGWEKKGWRINFKELWNFVGLARAAIEENLEKPVEIKTFFEDVAKTLADKNKPLSWTSPSGMPVSIRCFPWLTTTIQFHIGGKLRQHRLATVQGAEIDKAAAKRQAAPNFVHSCDAAHMALVTNQCVKKGIVDLAMVHNFLDAPLRRPVAFARLFVSSSCECTGKRRARADARCSRSRPRY